MTDIKEKSSGWRGSPELWLEAAYQVLVDTGVDAVKVANLAQTLNLSRTSFYYHFKDREELLQALIERWQQKNTGNLIAQTERYAESIAEALYNLFDCWVDNAFFDRHLDMAIRNWAAQSSELKQVVDSVDQRRIQAISAMYQRFDYNVSDAEVRAMTTYYTQVGYMSLDVVEPADQRLHRMPHYVEIFSGVPPRPEDIARFVSRHPEFDMRP